MKKSGKGGGVSKTQKNPRDELTFNWRPEERSLLFFVHVVFNKTHRNNHNMVIVSLNNYEISGN